MEKLSMLHNSIQHKKIFIPQMLKARNNVDFAFVIQKLGEKR